MGALHNDKGPVLRRSVHISCTGPSSSTVTLGMKSSVLGMEHKCFDGVSGLEVLGLSM